jgi:hypothetical protein
MLQVTEIRHKLQSIKVQGYGSSLEVIKQIILRSDKLTYLSLKDSIVIK